MALPTDDARRKMVRAFQGFVVYFPDAIALVAYLSKVANDQHNPGQPMHWAKEKSVEELDSLMNHLIDLGSRGELSQDTDGILDAVKVAWRGMANLQRLADKHGMDTLMDLMIIRDDVVEDDPTDVGWYNKCLTKGCESSVQAPVVRCNKCIADRNLDRLLAET
jgi:hypothetical protein